MNNKFDISKQLLKDIREKKGMFSDVMTDAKDYSILATLRWHIFNCRCTRFAPYRPRYFTVRANCSVCNGTSWVWHTDNEIWKRNGISMA